MCLKNMHILIADDYSDTATFLAELLEALAQDGTTTAVASDGAQALQLAQLCRPDVAVLDMSMPGMGGLEVGQHIRRLYGRRVVLVAMTGQHEKALAARSSDDFDHVFLKPVDIEQLLCITATSRPERP